MRDHNYWVYILASGPCGWLYVGMTNDLVRRVGEHKHGQVDGYSRDRGTDLLVWYEHHRHVDQAIRRENRIKRWLRAWKFALIEDANPHWNDLYLGLLAVGNPSTCSSSAPGTASAPPRPNRCSPPAPASRPRHRCFSLKAEEGGFRGEAPALPGCASHGETVEELMANMREAIEGWMAADAPVPASGYAHC